MKVLLILASVLHLGWLQEAREPFNAPDVCTEMGPDQGTCGDYNVRWFFNPQDGQCKQFMYSGCGGNENNFKTLEDCERMCKGAVQKSEEPKPTSGGDGTAEDAALKEPSSVQGQGKEEQDTIVPGSMNAEAETEQEATLEKDNEEDEEDGDIDDEEEDEHLIREYLNAGDSLSVEDSETLKEAMSQFDVSVLKEEEVPETEDMPTDVERSAEQQPTQEGDLRQPEEERANEESKERLQREEHSHLQNDEQQNSNAAQREGEAAVGDAGDQASRDVENKEAHEDDDDEYLENNDKAIDSFLDQLNSAISPNDRQTILEGVAQYGATFMGTPEEVEEGMEVVPFANEDARDAKEMEDGVSDRVPDDAREQSPEETSDPDDDDEEDGIDVEVEYPALKGIISPEDRETLAEAMSKFDVAEAITDGRKITDEIIARIPVETEEVETEESSEADDTNEKEHVKTEQQVPNNNEPQDTGNTESEHKELDMNDQDEKMISKLVSNYNVDVVEKKPDSGDEASSQNEERQEDNRKREQHDSKEPDTNGLLSPRCTLPPATGPCRARKPRWFFDMETGKCSPFIYGGCQGNGNRFPTMEICLASCLDMQEIPMPNPRMPLMPTQSPTKKITFMMPLFGRFNERVAGVERTNPIGRIAPSSAFANQEMVPLMRHPPRGMGPRQDKLVPDVETAKDDVRSPFSQLRFIISRAMRKAAKHDIRPSVGRSPQSLGLPSRIRILLPRPQAVDMSSFQNQQPIPKLPRLRSLVQMMEQIRIPPMQGFPPFRPNEDFVERTEDRAVFAPHVVKKSEFESVRYDNRRLNNVSPNNKFTLLQVFVNKRGGRRPDAERPRRPREPAMSRKAPPPAAMSPEPLNQMPNRFEPDYQMTHPIRSPYAPYPTAFWNPQAPYQHGLNPIPYNHLKPFARAPMSFVPQPYQPRPRPMHRRLPVARPVAISRQSLDEARDEQKSRYACLLPLAPGRCKSYQTKWYYSQESGKCEIFYYTGCAGNANNFETWEECAAVCLDLEASSERRSSSSEPTEADTVEETPAESEQPDTIIITSTRYPATDAEEKQANEDAQTEAPSGDKQYSSTTESEAPRKEEETEKGAEKEHEDTVAEEFEGGHVVISEADTSSTHYVLLLAIIATVALAVIVLVSISIVHLCKKMKTTKKERVLEAVIKQQLSGEAPQIVYTAKPAPEEKDKAQA